ncbi:hypothetical protein DFH09DRAFT_1271530 [Mycena vulgaris]|nr:hypothetical protein DFH09DRAFT_1271530 [Mycena vulgaris]
MAPSSAPAPDGSLGLAEIVLVLATFLYDIETLQTYNYYREYPKDSRGLKTLVAVIWLLELAHMICACHATYSITFYGQPEHILNPPLSLVFAIITQAAIYFIVQTFFSFRARMLSKRWSMAILGCILNTLRLLFNVGLFVELWKRPEWAFLVTDLRWIMITVSSIGPSVDILIATSFCYYLWHYKNSEFKQTSRMVDTLIIWTVETTAITTLSGALQLILFLTRNDLTWLFFWVVQAKCKILFHIFSLIKTCQTVFANSMLASLNGRNRFRSTPDRPRPFDSMVPARDTQMTTTENRNDDVCAPKPSESIRVCSANDVGITQAEIESLCRLSVLDTVHFCCRWNHLLRPERLRELSVTFGLGDDLVAFPSFPNGAKPCDADRALRIFSKFPALEAIALWQGVPQVEPKLRATDLFPFLTEYSGPSHTLRFFLALSTLVRLEVHRCRPNTFLVQLEGVYLYDKPTGSGGIP